MYGKGLNFFAKYIMMDNNGIDCDNALNQGVKKTYARNESYTVF